MSLSNCRRIVERLAYEFPSRSGLNPEMLRGAAEFIEHEFSTLGLVVDSQYYRSHGNQVRNLLAQTPGSDPGLAPIVLGAHYDTVLETPGADDNASGVAGLLELARKLNERPNRHTIIYAAFTHEEPPYFWTSAMGSRRYARRLKDEKRKITAMLCLEMIGYAGEELPQEYPFPLLRQVGGYPRNGNYIALVSNLRSVGILGTVRTAMRRSRRVRVESIAAPGFLPPLFLSDHSSFWKAGYRALMVTDTAFLRNPHYHLPGDLPETLNFDFLESVVESLFDAVVALDSTSSEFSP